MSRRQCCEAALCALTLCFVVGVLGACGEDQPASTASSTPSIAAPGAVEPPPAPKATSADRQDAINGIVSDYLSQIIDVPSSVRDPATATATINKLAGEVGDAPGECKTAVTKVSQIVERTDLSGVAKRKRVLDAMLPVYGDC